MFSPQVLKGAAAPHSIFCSPFLLLWNPPHTELILREWQSRQFVCCFLPSHHILAMSGTHTKARWWQYKSLSAANIWGGGGTEVALICSHGSGWLRAAPLLVTRGIDWNQWNRRTKLGLHLPGVIGMQSMKLKSGEEASLQFWKVIVTKFQSPNQLLLCPCQAEGSYGKSIQFKFLDLSKGEITISETEIHKLQSSVSPSLISPSLDSSSLKWMSWGHLLLYLLSLKFCDHRIFGPKPASSM